MEAGTTVGNHWKLEMLIGSGVTSVTWKAQALQGNAAGLPEGTPVVVKILSFGALESWKAFELFEREAAVLKELSHPAIPAFYDYFKLQEPQSERFVLVMEFIEGMNLQLLIDRGKRLTEAEVEGMLASLLEILSYLHSLRPPILHRDVSPKNILQRPDGSLSLVDFSGVQDSIRTETQDSATMVGSAGYAPMEQLMGRAGPRSDLYAAAAVAAFLLTHKHPADLPVKGMALDPGAVVELSPRLAFVLDAYLKADEKARTLSVDRAIAMLRGLETPPENKSAHVEPSATELLADPRVKKLVNFLGINLAQRAADPEISFDGRNEEVPEELGMPSDTAVTIEESEDRLVIAIPPNRSGLVAMIPIAFFSLFWLGVVGFMTVIMLMMGVVLGILFLLPFWAVGIFLVRTFLGALFTRATVEITRTDGLKFQSTTLGMKKTLARPLGDIGACTIEAASFRMSGSDITELSLVAGTKKLGFGRGLSRREQNTIAGKIKDFVASARG